MDEITGDQPGSVIPEDLRLNEDLLESRSPRQTSTKSKKDKETNMKTMSHNDFMACPAASDINPLRHTPFSPQSAIDEFDRTSATEYARAALNFPHYVFENAIYFSRKHDLYKITRTLTGWTDETPVTCTFEQHKAWPNLSNCVSHEDNLKIQSTGRCHS